MEIIVEKLTANQTKTFRKAGGYMEIIDSSYAVGLNFYSDLGGQINSLKGGLSGLYLQADFGAFDVVNGAIAQTVTLLICDKGEIGGSRRQPGTVRVIDQGTDKTRAGQQFLHSIGQAANAGSVSLVSIGANARTISIKRIQISSTIAGAVNVITGLASGTATPVSTSMRNKLVGGASSTSFMGIGYTAGTLPAAGEMAGAAYWTLMNLQANQIAEVPITTPIVISGTQFVAFSGTVLNRDISVTIDCEEVT